MHFSSPQNGSTALALLSGFVALGLATISIQNSAQKENAALSREKLRQTEESMRISSLSSMSRFKAILSERKDNASGHHLPGLFADDYYKSQWKLLENPDVKILASSLSPDGKSLDIQAATSSDMGALDVQKVLTGIQSTKDLPSTPSKIRVLRTNFDASQSLVETIDVEAAILVQGKVSRSVFRVPIPAPEPYNPILEISPAGTETWTRNFTDIAPGNYDLRVLASGIAFDADILLDETKIAKVGGFALGSGKVKHKAVHYLAKDEEVGRTTFSFEGSGGGYGDPSTCKYIRTDKTYKFRIQVNGPGAKSKAELSGIEVKVKASPAPALDINALSLACNDQCIYAGPLDSMTPNIEDQLLTQGQYGDMSHFHMMHDLRPAWDLHDKKVCMNFEKANEAILANHGHPILIGSDLAGPEGALLEVVAYDPGSCQRQFVFERSSCGCFAEDSRILLGDQKTEKAISELTEKDLVWNPKLGKAFPILRVTRGPETVPMLEVQVGEKKLRVTGNHPFPTKAGMKAAYDLEIGEAIRLESGIWASIEDIQAIEIDDKAPIVWNLEVDAPLDNLGAHEIVANGIVTGDLYIQTLLETRE